MFNLNIYKMEYIYLYKYLTNFQGKKEIIILLLSIPNIFIKKKISLISSPQLSSRFKAFT